MEVLQEYKCPCCGGAIAFDSGLQKMKCPYCDTEFEMETLAGYDSALKEEVPDELKWENTNSAPWQEEGVRSYVCNSCGGEIIGDENTAATACPFCGNPVVMMEQFAGTLKPELVIPFQLDKKAAIAALKKHYEGKRLLVICSFTDKSVGFWAPEGFDLSKGKCVLCNYENNTVHGNGFTTRPYETRVYYFE